MQWASSMTSSPVRRISSGSWFSRKDGLVSRSGRDQQDVHLVGGQLLADGVPLQLVGGVDGHGAHSGPRGGRHLVPHQGQQRARQSGWARRRGAAAAGTPQSTRPIFPSRCAGPPGPGGRRRPGPRWPQTGRRGTPRPGAPPARAALPGPAPGSRTRRRRHRRMRVEAERTAAFWLLAIASVSQPPPTAAKPRAPLCGQSLRIRRGPAADAVSRSSTAVLGFNVR